MIERKTLTLAAAVLAFAACGDMTAPATDAAALAKGGKKAATVSVDTATTADGGSDSGPVASSDAAVPANTIRQSADAPALMTYQTSFTAIQGEGNTFVVFYEDPWTDAGLPGHWFMKLHVPRDAQLLRPDGSPAAPGESVEITVEIDPSLFLVQFGPHGSQFDGKKPAQLSFSLKFAEPLSRQAKDDLQALYQPARGERWTPRATTVDVKRNRVVLDLYHFSNYAIAF